MTGACCVVPVINSKNIHTIDWNLGFESRIAHVYKHKDSCVFVCVCRWGSTGGLLPHKSSTKSLKTSFGIGSGT
jgi:hypothetical protein